MNTFIDRLDEVLKAQGKNRNDLYDNLHIAKNMIGNWKQRGTIPNADIVCKIAKYLNTTVEYLVTGIDSSGYKTKYETLLQDLQQILDKNR